MDKGKIIIEGTPAELVEQMGSDSIQIIGEGNIDDFSNRIGGLSFVENFTSVNNIVQIGVDSGNP